MRPTEAVAQEAIFAGIVGARADGSGSADDLAPFARPEVVGSLRFGGGGRSKWHDR
jgi:hypothetical protein